MSLIVIIKIIVGDSLMNYSFKNKKKEKNSANQSFSEF